MEFINLIGIVIYATAATAMFVICTTSSYPTVLVIEFMLSSFIGTPSPASLIAWHLLFKP